MHTWLLITVIATAAIAGVSLLLILRRLLYPSLATPTQTSITKLRQIDIKSNKKPNHYVFGRDGSSRKTLFSWSDHPSLATNAFENGWSRFSFTAPYASSQSIQSSKMQSLLGVCGARAEERETGVEIAWEASPGLTDFMQKIRLNSGLKKINSVSVIKTALPLPGPSLGNNSSFPQEAYFEITVLRAGGDGEGQFGNLMGIRTESERVKLIKQNLGGKGDSESIVHVISSMHGSNKAYAGFKFGGVLVSIGLVRSGPLPLKAPGCYPGSVGFNSNGSVYLDGIKLVLESQKQGWGEPERVIGCGYNPIQKRVFFTLDSQLVHVISCKTEEFGTPLYPTLAANSDVTVLVNFGQRAFKYLPANSQRSPNPCFIGPLAHSPELGYEDSQELFSMGRIDSQWLNRLTTRNCDSNYGGNTKIGVDFDGESEGDLFEIGLDGPAEFPNTTL